MANGAVCKTAHAGSIPAHLSKLCPQGLVGERPNAWTALAADELKAE
jgi:hypothetical protein